MHNNNYVPVSQHADPLVAFMVMAQEKYANVKFGPRLKTFGHPWSKAMLE